MKYKILLVDDHPLILEGYKNVLQNSSYGDDYGFHLVENLDEAYKRLKSSEGDRAFDLICLDMNMPPAEGLGLLSGEDLGIFVRENFQGTKIIVLTMHSDNFRLYNIIKNVNPDGFLIKKDIKPVHLITAFSEVLKNKTYYSPTVNSVLRKQLNSDIILDKFDRKILFYLSQGIKTKDLPQFIPLSLAAIEKRKKNLKEAMEVSDHGDLILIKKAKDTGFL